jgi:hypothetical protein
VGSAGQSCLLASTIEDPLVGKLHNMSALLYFIILIVYALFLFPKTHMDMVTGEKKFMGKMKRMRNVVYYICGALMTASLLLILAFMWFLLDLFPGLNQLNPVFWLEAVVLFSFGISWLTKGQLFFRDENYKKGP